MVKVLGRSDDLVEIYNSEYYENEIDCYDEPVTIWFTDGTIIRVEYGKDNKAIWKIEILEEGTSVNELTVCDDEDAIVYSDIFEIDAEIENHCVGEVIEDVQELKIEFRKLKQEYPLRYIETAYEEIIGRDL